jgi:hypothetical protein
LAADLAILRTIRQQAAQLAADAREAREAEAAARQVNHMVAVPSNLKA